MSTCRKRKREEGRKKSVFVMAFLWQGHFLASCILASTLLHSVIESSSCSRILIRRPTPLIASDYANRYLLKPYNHDYALVFVNDSDVDLPKGYKVIKLTQKLGSGQKTYQRAKKILKTFNMHSGSKTSGIYVGPEGAVTTFARSAPFLWSMNPCRRTHSEECENDRHTRVGYATLQGHLIAGAETMEIRQQGCDVFFELVSISRGSGPLGRIIFPFIRRTQLKFFQEQASTMLGLCSERNDVSMDAPP